VSFDRDAAVEAAMNLFWKRGFPAVSASDLAQAMAIQRSSFYNSFGSREAVFREALERYVAEAPDSPLDRWQPGEPAAELLARVLRAACRARIADREARGCLAGNAVSDLVGVDQELGPLLAAAIEHRIASVERILGGAVDAREIADPPDLAAAALGFVAFLMGLNALSKVVRSEAKLWAMCESFLRGLGLPATTIESVGQAGASQRSTPTKRDRHD